MITIFSKEYCPYCDMAKGLLESLGYDYIEVDLTNDYDKLREIVSISGMMTVPQIFNGEIIKENFLGGYSDIRSLNDEGKLINILNNKN